jgi:hypothetical protein
MLAIAESQPASIASDGARIFVYGPSGLAVVGSGFGGTTRGTVYQCNPSFRRNDEARARVQTVCCSLVLWAMRGSWCWGLSALPGVVTRRLACARLPPGLAAPCQRNAALLLSISVCRVKARNRGVGHDACGGNRSHSHARSFISCFDFDVRYLCVVTTPCVQVGSIPLPAGVTVSAGSGALDFDLGDDLGDDPELARAIALSLAAQGTLRLFEWLPCGRDALYSMLHRIMSPWRVMSRGVFCIVCVWFDVW